MSGPRVQPDLLGQPHHDGSALYVSNPYPALGESVTVRVRVPSDADVTAVHVRTTPDAEPVFTDAAVERTTGTETWWAAQVVCHNPVTNYRFILEGGPTAYQWLNGTGVHQRDVPDAADFRLTAFGAPPAWAGEAVVYQVFPDRFARSAGQDSRDVPEWAVPAGWDRDTAAGAGCHLSAAVRRRPRRHHRAAGPHRRARRQRRLPDAVLPRPLQPPL